MYYRASILSVALAASVHAAIIRVPGDQPTIQAGLDSASEGDTVSVAPGTYAGAGNKNLDFLGRNLVLESEQGQEATVIDCEGWGRGLSFHSGERAASMVSGFTVTGGKEHYSGGVHCEFSDPTFTDCTIAGNNAASGDGGGVSCIRSSATFIHCDIRDNTAADHAGGVRCLESAPTFINCAITGNRATFGGGGVGSVESDLTITGCTIASNTTTDSHGGGIAIFDVDPSTIAITNCTIAGNRAIHGDGGALWIFALATNPKFTNCIFWGNSPNEVSGAHHYLGDPTITYCDIEGGWDGVGNIEIDPLFISLPGFANLLRPGSPCIDAGDPSIEDGISDRHPRWPGWVPNGVRSDMGAYGGPGNRGWLR